MLSAKEVCTSDVRLHTLVRTRPFCTNHQKRVYSPDRTRPSKLLMKLANEIVSCSSRRRKAGSTLIFADKMRPVAPKPQREALKRSGRTVSEHVIIDPSAIISLSSRTIVDKTPKSMPVPCVAVVMTPAIVWSDFEPRFDIARLWAVRHSWSA